MTRDESTPDFNWLNQEMGSGRLDDASKSDSSTSLADPPEEGEEGNAPASQSDSPEEDQEESASESASALAPAESRQEPSEQDEPAPEPEAAQDEPAAASPPADGEVDRPSENALDDDDVEAASQDAHQTTDVFTPPQEPGPEESAEDTSSPAPPVQELEAESSAADSALSEPAKPTSTEPAAKEQNEAIPQLFPSADDPPEAAAEAETGQPAFQFEEPAAPPVSETKSPEPAAESPTEAESTPKPAPEASADAPPSSPAKSSPPSRAAESSPFKQQNLVLIILASYASAVTLALLMMLMGRGGDGAKPHHLESLPDVEPEPVGELSYVPAHWELAPGHTLRLGESQRYGNILVEPVRIVKEPVEFVHYSGDSSQTRPPSAPVWKLWLRMTNVSDKQEITPLDRHLLLRWVLKSDEFREYSNYYIAPQGVSEDAPAVQAYPLSNTSDWDMKSQKLGHVLAPGESYETYIATSEEGLESLSGDLLWRFQFRKGHGPKGHGVTTVVEVAFRPEDVTPGERGT
jgi:hypothetical protein